MLQGEDGHQNHEIFHPQKKMVSISHSGVQIFYSLYATSVDSDADDEYEFDDEEYLEEFLRRLDKAESDAIASKLILLSISEIFLIFWLPLNAELKRLEAEADTRKKRLADLQEAANHPLSCTDHSFSLQHRILIFSYRTIL